MALEALKNGHRKALRVVEKLEGVLSHVRDGDLAAAIPIIRKSLPFLEKEQEVHFRQEEEGLFLYLAKVAGEGPIQAMVGEHEAYWKAVSSLRELVERGGEAGQAERLLDHLVNLLRGHIHREETAYFPLAEERLSSRQLEAVDSEMEAIARMR